MIIAAGAAAVAKWPHAWWWLVVVMVTATAVAPPTIAALSQSLQRRQEIGRVARAGLQGTTGSDGHRLPTAGSSDLEARVHESVLPIPYIHRDVEDNICSYLRAQHPVLLIGSSMVGKTKMAARIIAEEFSSWPIAIPDSKTALADMDAKDVTLQDSVIWLDDIDRLIGAGGITDGALRRLAATGNVIVATIRARAYDQFQPSDQLRPPEWDVLSVFEHVFVDRDLTEHEQEQLTDALADPEIRDRIRTVGLGEYVGAAGQIVEALKLGSAGTEPLGYALVLAAADWRRCGMTRPISTTILADMARPHLDNRGRARLADPDAFNAGLTWATRDINPNVALLQPEATDSYSIYDYALDRISAQGTSIPDSTWAVIMANADIAELMLLGYTAHAVYHHDEIAAQAWRQAANSGDADVAPMAELGLGMLMRIHGDAQGAEDAFQKVIDSGDAEAAPLAAGQLGALLYEQGDEQGAAAAFQKAVDSGHADQAPKAAFALGLLLEKQGDVQGAKDLFQEVVDSGHADQAPMAATRLGLLLEKQGDVQGAKDLFQEAVDSGHADQAPMAATRLGLLLEKQGDVQGAKDLFQEAVDSGHADQAPKAALCLGTLLQEQGDVQGAAAAFQEAIDSGHADQAPVAGLCLGTLLQEHGDTQGAVAAFQEAIDSGHADAAPFAAGQLGVLLDEQGDVQGAKDAFQKAIDSGHADQAPRAALALGLLLQGEGDVQGAATAFQKAIDFGHADHATKPAANLIALLHQLGNALGATDAYQTAIDAEPMAAFGPGLLLEKQGDVQGATDA